MRLDHKIKDNQCPSTWSLDDLREEHHGTRQIVLIKIPTSNIYGDINDIL
jgi:hypothetical protein